VDATYDLVVIGAGSAGLIAAPFASTVGAKVLFAEKDRIGGDCTWTGCIPSKALIHTAGMVHCMRDAAALLGGPSTAPLDAGRVMERVRAAIDGVYAFETPEALAAQGVEVAFGSAHFIDERTIAIGERHVTGRHVIVCTGAEPIVPSIAGLSQTRFLTYKDVFALKAIPHRLVVLGSGPTGAELAQAFGRLGSQVVLVEAADRILPVADPDASAVLSDRLAREGVKVFVRAPVDHVEGTGDGIAISAAGRRIEGDALLVAVGRRPHLDALNLQGAGVAFSEDGISVDSNLRTTNPRIYAAGDAAGSMQFTHYAGWQGYVAARNALFPGTMRGKRKGVPWVVFTDPEVGQVGLTEDEARHGGGRTEVLRLPLERIDRAQTTGELDGFIKLVTRNETLVGATVVAPVAGEIINELALAIQSKMTLRQLSSTIHVYPTYGIGIQQLASRANLAGFVRGWQGRLLHRLMKRSA
jgi:pyruvate/2-oxoglutarate dehydrogenase complex dihydrolipoamide dehydrogenase (E3) component